MGAAIALSKDNFTSEVLQAKGSVLVDFWAEWCGPCKMLSPIIDELAVQLAGQIKITKLNVDDSPDLAGEYEVMSIPTLLIFKDGQVVDQIVGAMPKNQLLAKLQPYLKA